MTAVPGLPPALWSAGSYAVAPDSMWRGFGVDVAESVGSSPFRHALASLDGRLAVQRRGSLAGEVLHPEPAVLSALVSTDDAVRIRDGIEAYNRWAADFAASAPDRLVA